MRKIQKVLAAAVCLAVIAAFPVAAETAYDNIAISHVTNYVNVRLEPNTSSQVVGKIYNNCAASILSVVPGEGGDWYQMQSGSVTGYIKSEYFITGQEAEAIAREVGQTYGTITSQTSLRLREKPDTNSSVLTQLAPGTRYPVEGEEHGFVKLNVDTELVGYASLEYVKLEVEFKKAVSLEEEQAAAAQTAQRQQEVSSALGKLDELKKQDPTIPIVVPPVPVMEENRLITGPPPLQDGGQTTNAPLENTQVISQGGPGMNLSGEVSSATRDAIVAYAKQFLGNPYVYGGTSLTEGADCSGFTQAVYAHFGIAIGRSSRDQAVKGKEVSWENAKPGDLLFYSSNDYINHVAMYIGGGKVIHSSTPQTGITITSANYRTPCKAVTFLE